MLARENRLTKKEDFSRVYENGRYFCQNNISIKFLKATGLEVRVGFSIGKNYSKLATERNKARRILRHAMLKNITNIKPGYDIVIMLKKGKHTQSKFSMIEALKDFETIFSKTNLYK